MENVGTYSLPEAQIRYRALLIDDSEGLGGAVTWTDALKFCRALYYKSCVTNRINL